MILVDIRPRQDDKYDMYVGDEGDHFVNSNQGYERAEDCIAIARRLWPKGTGSFGSEVADSIYLRVTYRDGRTWTERLR